MSSSESVKFRRSSYTDDALTFPAGKALASFLSVLMNFTLVMKVMRKYKEKDPEVNIGKVYAVFDEEGRGKISVSMKITDLVTA